MFLIIFLWLFVSDYLVIIVWYYLHITICLWLACFYCLIDVMCLLAVIIIDYRFLTIFLWLFVSDYLVSVFWYYLHIISCFWLSCYYCLIHFPMIIRFWLSCYYFLILSSYYYLLLIILLLLFDSSSYDYSFLIILLSLYDIIFILLFVSDDLVLIVWVMSCSHYLS